MIAGNRLATRTKIGYSTFNCGESTAYNLFYTYFLLFMTNFAGVEPAVGGTIALIAVLWDGVTDALVGYFSDKSTNPKGRRRPFMAKFLIPFAIMLTLVFSDFGLTGGAQVAFYLGMNILFWLFFTLVDVPAITLGGEITEDPSEQRSIRSWATMMNYLGFLLATSFTPQLANYFGQFFEKPTSGWTVVVAGFAVLLVIAYVISLVSTKGLETPLSKEDAERKQSNVFKSMFSTMKLKPFRGLWLYCLIFQASVFLCTSTLIYVIYYVCGGTDLNAAQIFLTYGVFTIIVSPIMDKIALRVNNKKALVIGMGVQGLLLIAFGVFLPLTVVTMNIMMFGVAVGMASYYVLSYSMVYEVADVASLKLGKDTSTGSGTFIACYQCAQKIGGAIGMWGAGIALQIVKYDANNVTEHAVSGIRFVSTTLAGGIVIAGVIVCAILYKLEPSIKAKLVELTKKEELTAEEQSIVDENL